MKINLCLKNETNSSLADEKLLTKIAKQVLKNFNQQKAQISLTVFYVDTQKIKEINSEYRDKDKETDVISFRYVDNPQNLPLDKKNFSLKAQKQSILAKFLFVKRLPKHKRQNLEIPLLERA